MKRYPLEGVKVCDFGWAIAGGLSSTLLGEYGAEVIRIESMARYDPVRTYSPFLGRKPGINRSGLFHAVNNSKRSITIDFGHPKGPELVKKLIAWADVMIENFSGGAIQKMGLSYEELKQVKQDIILISASPRGQEGPYSKVAGGAMSEQGLSGFTYLTGWPDREPAGPWVPYTDYLTPPYVVVLTIMALDYHASTGKGQWIDLSQYELCLNCLAEAIVDYTANGEVQGPVGNYHKAAAPHGAYRCKGDDCWCAIAVTNDEECVNFCEVIGNPEWVKDNKFATAPDRVKNSSELKGLVETWTTGYPPEIVMTMMQANGVPAGIVANGHNLQNAPYLEARDHYYILDHPETGPTIYEGPPARLSKTPAEVRMPAPCLGEHSEYVLTNILGMSGGEVVELINSGVIR